MLNCKINGFHFSLKSPTSIIKLCKLNNIYSIDGIYIIVQEYDSPYIWFPLQEYSFFINGIKYIFNIEKTDYMYSLIYECMIIDGYQSSFSRFEIFCNSAHAGDLHCAYMSFSKNHIPLQQQILNNLRTAINNYTLCEKDTVIYEQTYNGGILKPFDGTIKRIYKNIVIYYNKNTDFENYLDKIIDD